MDFSKDDTYFPKELYWYKEQLVTEREEIAILDLMHNFNITVNQLAELAADCCEFMPDMLVIIVGLLRIDTKTSIHPKLGVPLFTTIATVGDYTSIKMALEKGADVNYTGTYGIPPLLQAVRFHRPKEIIELLLESGADPNATVDGRNVIDFYRSGIDPDLLDFYEGKTADLRELCIKYGMNIPA